MFFSKKPQNSSKFNSMAQIQIKCVKLSKQMNTSKTNRSNSSLNITSPTSNTKEKHEDMINVLKPKVMNNMNNVINSINSTPKQYFLMPTHNSNSSLNRSKTLHHKKPINAPNSLNSHEQLNDSNKENHLQIQNSLNVLSKNSKIVQDENSGNHDNHAWNSINIKDIRETDEDMIGAENRIESQRVNEFFCLRHPMKKAKYFIQDKNKALSAENLLFCCSKCAIDLASQGKKVYNIEEDLKNKPAQTIDFSDPYNKIAEESYKNTIIDEIVENIVEIDSKEIGKRDTDLSRFMKKLEVLKQESSVAYEQLNNRKKDVIFFYDKQIIKLDQIYNNLLRVIEKEKNQSTAKLKQFMTKTTNSFNSMISQMDTNLKDMNFIYNDIEQNRPNILKHMETDPFNLILSKYEEKLNTYENFSQSLYIEKLILEKMTNSSIKIYQKKIDDVLSPHIVSLFSTFEVSTSYLKKDVTIESESPIPLEKNLPKYAIFNNMNNGNNNNSNNYMKNNENNSIYISFENKEMFENAIRNSLASKPNSIEMPMLSPVGNIATPILTPDILSNFQMNINKTPKEQKLYETCSVFGKNSSSTLSNNNKESDFITTPKSTEKCIREFNSAQPGKLMNNLNKDFNKNNKNKRFQSTDKLQNKKYLTLLEKVNNNQNNTNVFYSNMLQSREKTHENNNKSLGLFQSLDKNSKIEKKTLNSSGNVIQPSPLKPMPQTKEIKHYEGFFNYIENKLQDDNVAGGNCNSYQKTLFCSSPHFKDV